MDEHTTDVLEFPSVLALLSEYTRSAQGRTAVLGIRPAAGPEGAERRLDEVEEASRFLAKHGRLACELSDPGSLVEAVARPDCLLETTGLLTVAEYLRFLEAARRDLVESDFPVLASRVAEVPAPPFLLSRIENSIDERGGIRDSAHPELRSIRRRQEQARRQLEDQLNLLIHGPKARFLAPEAFVTQRAERYVVPVRVDCRREVPGLVHGTSSSGATVFVEPLEAVELNNDFVYARERENEIVRQVLSDLSREVLVHRETLARIVELSADLDARFAVAEWSELNLCSRPRILAGNRLELAGARHPLLNQSLGVSKVVPIDVELSGPSSVLIISGPNTGGKTAALKTVGLVCLMARCGLPVPARQVSLPWFQGIFADIGDFQSIIHHLSTFSSHLARLNEILRRHSAPALVLLDELGRGTDPVYGAALATSVIDWIREAGSFVMATTHHRAVKLYAATTPGVRNASVLLDPVTQRPTYAIEYGVAGDSSGLEIARQLGLPAGILTRAEGLLGTRDRQWEQYLRDLREELGRLREQERDLESQRRRFGELEIQLRQQSADQESRRQREFEKYLERLADEFRREGSRYLKRMLDQDQIRETRRQIALREAALKESFRRRRQADSEPHPATSPAVSLAPGDLVYHPLFRFRGTVEAVEGTQVRVQVAGKSMTTRLQDLRKIETREVEEKPSREITIRVVESTDPELSLIGLTVEEAEENLDKFLDRAFISRLPEVRIIHGFGTGRLKRSVSQLLSRHPHVQEFEVEGGATRVMLKN
jgi:DNA mismatch repair protein MutS2